MTVAARVGAVAFWLLASGAGCRSRAAEPAQPGPASESKSAPFGAWESPISAQQVASQSVDLSAPRVDGDAIYWLEARPAEQGRVVVVRWTEAQGAVDAMPAGFSARSRAHGYGGGSYTVDRATVYFANYRDRRVYRVSPGQAPEPLTEASDVDWFADFEVDRGRNRLIAVRERHAPDAAPVDALVAIDLAGGGVTELHTGPDFLGAPRLSPDGARLAFVSWTLPNMPWDTTSLWLADLGEDGALAKPRRVAGGDDESVVQPTWLPGGQLLFVSDRSSWWNVYAFDPAGAAERSLAPRSAEFTTPPWTFDTQTLAVAGGRIVAAFTEGGRWYAGELGGAGGDLRTITDHFVAIEGVAAGETGTVAVIGGTARDTWEVARLDLDSGRLRQLRRSSDDAVPAGYLSLGEPLSFPTAGGQQAHAFFYPPRNPAFSAPPGTRPPLLVTAHGGPTGATSAALKLHVQFWTSRGFAVVDVNYRGSTGYGRAYRRALYGRWGVADVEDLAAAVRFLADRGDIDPNRVAVRGGSAGGFSTLNALVHHGEFKAGAAYSSISDLEALARDTHKFESRYLDQLVGPYPQAQSIYRERSPIAHLDKLDKPLVLFHGREDRVTPVNQAEMLHRALEERGIASELHVYDGEGHGLRRADNRVASLKDELAFYRRVFGL